ncbi:hypothetical protein Nepgr_016440 [Nepenthes gracilis]|uniref:Uncharacterized protein n=1 Tax=Nepenthes gracilis TaxID=150966 RepID=A0AAD3SPP9_NEPGR|nr:hypothetical protein Nepgr_016440 [Nepenthes gracilis]
MAPVLKPIPVSPPKATRSSPLSTPPTAASPPLSPCLSPPPLIKSPPFSRRLGRWRSSSPPSVGAHLFDTNFPSIQASHSIPPKSRRLAAVAAPPARGLSALPPTPSPPTFQSSYTSNLFCYELPESHSKAPKTPSVDLLGVLINPACSSASSLGDSGYKALLPPKSMPRFRMEMIWGAPVNSRVLLSYPVVPLLQPVIWLLPIALCGPPW